MGNTLVQFVTPAVRAILGLLLAAALSRYLGVEGLGQYALVFAYVGTFNGIFNDWGLGTILLREIARFPERRAELLVSGAALQGLVALGSYVLMVGGLAIVHFPGAVKQAVLIYGLTLLLTPLDLLALSFQADLKLSRLLPASLAGALLNFGFLMLVMVFRGGLLALIAAVLAALVIQYMWIARLCWASQRFPCRPATAHWNPFLREAWPLGLTTVFTTTMQQAPVMVLSWHSLEAVGLFSAAYKIPQQLLLLPLMVRNSAFPVLARSWVVDRPRFSRQLDRLVGGIILISVPMVIAGVGLAAPLTVLVFGPDFAGAAGPFGLLIGVCGLVFPGILIGEALNAAGYQRGNLVIQVLSSGALIVLLLVLVPSGGAAGAALALLLSYGLVVGATLLVARWRFQDGAPLGAMGVGAMSAASGGVGLIAASGLGPLPASIVGAAVALAVLVALRGSQVRGLWAAVTGSRLAG